MVSGSTSLPANSNAQTVAAAAIFVQLSGFIALKVLKLAELSIGVRNPRNGFVKK